MFCLSAVSLAKYPVWLSCHAALNGAIPISYLWKMGWLLKFHTATLSVPLLRFPFFLAKLIVTRLHVGLCRTHDNTNTKADLWWCWIFTCDENTCQCPVPLAWCAWAVPELSKVVHELECPLMPTSLPTHIALNGDLCSSMIKCSKTQVDLVDVSLFGMFIKAVEKVSCSF